MVRVVYRIQSGAAREGTCDLRLTWDVVKVLLSLMSVKATRYNPKRCPGLEIFAACENDAAVLGNHAVNQGFAGIAKLVECICK